MRSSAPELPLARVQRWDLPEAAREDVWFALSPNEAHGFWLYLRAQLRAALQSLRGFEEESAFSCLRILPPPDEREALQFKAATFRRLLRAYEASFHDAQVPILSLLRRGLDPPGTAVMALVLTHELSYWSREHKPRLTRALDKTMVEAITQLAEVFGELVGAPVADLDRWSLGLRAPERLRRFGVLPDGDVFDVPDAGRETARITALNRDIAHHLQANLREWVYASERLIHFPEGQAVDAPCDPDVFASGWHYRFVAELEADEDLTEDQSWPAQGIAEEVRAKFLLACPAVGNRLPYRWMKLRTGPVLAELFEDFCAWLLREGRGVPKSPPVGSKPTPYAPFWHALVRAVGSDDAVRELAMRAMPRVAQRERQQQEEEKLTRAQKARQIRQDVEDGLIDLPPEALAAIDALLNPPPRPPPPTPPPPPTWWGRGMERPFFLSHDMLTATILLAFPVGMFLHSARPIALPHGYRGGLLLVAFGFALLLAAAYLIVVPAFSIAPALRPRSTSAPTKTHDRFAVVLFLYVFALPLGGSGFCTAAGWAAASGGWWPHLHGGFNGAVTGLGVGFILVFYGFLALGAAYLALGWLRDRICAQPADPTVITG